MNKDFFLFLISVLVGAIIPLMIFGGYFYFKEVQEIQLHDTYFIFNPFEFSLVTIGPILSIAFIVRVMQTRFKNKLSFTFLFVGLAITALVALEVYEIATKLQGRWTIQAP